MRIISFGHDIDHRCVDLELYGSSVSLLDYDCLIWNPEGLFDTYQAKFAHPTHQGYRSLDDDDSARITSDIARRRSEILELNDLGRVVVIFVPPPGKCYYATGEYQYSGTGRSRVATRIVNPLTVYATIPINGLSTTLAEGDKIEFRGGEPFKSFWNKVRGLLHYGAYLSGSLGKPFLYIRGTSKVLGTWIPTKKGVLLLLPPLMTESHFKTKKDFKSACTIFVEALNEICSELKKTVGDYTLPAWTDRYLLPGEDSQRKEIQHRESEVDKLVQGVSALKEALANSLKTKLLLCGTGRALEVEVAAAFRELGFDVEDQQQGRDDLILKCGQKVAIVEIKGVNKSAAEKHAAQLEKFVSEYLTEHEVSPKGILVVNAYHDTPLDTRFQPSFPAQMIAYSASRQHCLLTTVQLLGLVLYVRNNPEQRDKLISELLDTNGTYSRFLDLKDFLLSPTPIVKTTETGTTESKPLG